MQRCIDEMYYGGQKWKIVVMEITEYIAWQVFEGDEKQGE